MCLEISVLRGRYVLVHRVTLHLSNGWSVPRGPNINGLRYLDMIMLPRSTQAYCRHRRGRYCSPLSIVSQSMVPVDVYTDRPRTWFMVVAVVVFSERLVTQGELIPFSTDRPTEQLPFESNYHASLWPHHRACPSEVSHQSW